MTSERIGTAVTFGSASPRSIGAITKSFYSAPRIASSQSAWMYASVYRRLHHRHENEDATHA